MHNWDNYMTLILNDFISSLSEAKSCICLAHFEDEDYVPDSCPYMRKDDLYFMRNTDYHESFLVYNVNLNSNDDEDPDILYKIWWEENIQEEFERKLEQEESFDGAYKDIFLNTKNAF